MATSYYVSAGDSAEAKLINRKHSDFHKKKRAYVKVKYGRIKETIDTLKQHKIGAKYCIIGNIIGHNCSLKHCSFKSADCHTINIWECDGDNILSHNANVYKSKVNNINCHDAYLDESEVNSIECHNADLHESAAKHITAVHINLSNSYAENIEIRDVCPNNHHRKVVLREKSSAGLIKFQGEPGIVLVDDSIDTSKINLENGVFENLRIFMDNMHRSTHEIIMAILHKAKQSS